MGVFDFRIEFQDMVNQSFIREFIISVSQCIQVDTVFHLGNFFQADFALAKAFRQQGFLAAGIGGTSIAAAGTFGAGLSAVCLATA